jgi:hypothetical protein
MPRFFTRTRRASHQDIVPTRILSDLLYLDFQLEQYIGWPGFEHFKEHTANYRRDYEQLREATTVEGTTLKMGINQKVLYERVKTDLQFS